MRGAFSCQWLTGRMEYSLIRWERLMKENGNLIRSMGKVKRHGPKIILSMKVIIKMGIDQGMEYSSETERLSIEENGVRI